MKINLGNSVFASIISLIISINSSHATVATLQEMQAANPNVAYQYTFEGTYEATGGTGTWIDQKVGSGTPDLKQGGSAVNRIAEQKTPGYDSSTNYAEFIAFGSGAQGEALLSDATISYATAGTIEYLVQFGSGMTSANSGSRFLISGDGSGDNDRLRFLAVAPVTSGAAPDKAVMTLGTNTPHDLIGGTTSVGYVVGDWYYVAQTWSILDGVVTMDAWVANLTAGGPLTQTINDASNAFVGNTTTILNLGGATNTYAIGNLDALAIYNTILDFETIQSHFYAIPEPASLALIGVALIPCLRRRLKRI